MADENTESTVSNEPHHVGHVDVSSTLISKPELFAERILGSKAVGGSITIPIQMHTNEGTQSITTTIPFYLGNDFSLGTLTNKWGDLVNMDFANNFTEMLNAVQSAQGESQVALQSENMSAKVWKGSEFNGFSVECLFIATRRTINPLKIIMTLASTALPSKLKSTDTTTAQSFTNVKNFVSGVVGALGGYIGDAINNENWKSAVSNGTNYIQKNLEDVGLIAPLYYGLKMDDGGSMVPLNDTSVTLHIGDWFEANHLLVQSVGNITFSKEMIAPVPKQHKDSKDKPLYNNGNRGKDYGFPLWGKCTLSLIPHAMMTKEKFQSYFKYKSDGMTGPLDSINKRLTDAVGGIKNAIDTHEKIFRLP